MEFDKSTEKLISENCIRLGKIISQTRKWFPKIGSGNVDPTTDKTHLIKELKWTTVKYKELPQWMQWNDYLHQGHRPPLPSYSACLKSWYRIHTETVNIWSHLLPSIAFLLIFIHNWFLSNYDVREKLAFSPYLIGFIICFGFSTGYHTFNCHSESVSMASRQCDYLGIVACMLGCVYSAMVYMWWCRWYWTVFYCALYTGLAYALFIIILWSPELTHGKKKRAVAAVSVGCSSLATLVHEIVANGFDHTMTIYPIKDVFAILGICLVAAAIYATRMPERIWAGKFDIWFHSHQLFHVLVAAAAFAGYHCLTSFAEFRYSFGNDNSCSAETILISE